MRQITDELLRDMVKVIVNEVDPERIILFGSHARGDASADSDVDFDVPKDILLYSSDEAEYWRDSVNHVLARVLREGKILYERPSANEA